VVDRRTFLAAAAAGLVALACGSGGSGASRTSGSSSTTAAAGTAATSAPPARARFVDSGTRTRDRVALTFHTDGDLELAQELLDVLAAHHTVITAFLVGEWLDTNPAWAKKLTNAGHELANHTYSHPAFLSLSPDRMRDEIERCRDVIVRLTGYPGVFFRPSGTDDGTASPPEAVLDVSAQAGYYTVLGFDVDPLDYTNPGADAIVQRTLDAVQPGSIVSLHFGHPGTVAAMPRILDGLDRRGLTPVTASALLA
jgi:peptidoglycan/xylan/chitin deacetylase (PgdA/CDA1 family)